MTKVSFRGIDKPNPYQAMPHRAAKGLLPNTMCSYPGGHAEVIAGMFLDPYYTESMYLSQNMSHLC